jgi:hypothetical protein
MNEDVIVYAHPNGRTYVAPFEAHGWQRWPAEQDGWSLRHACPATTADGCSELEPALGALALRLSGVTA